MRAILAPLLIPLLLCGCLETVALVGAGAVPVIGRTVPDAVVSTLAGRDCSVVRLDAGRAYCAAEAAVPVAPVVCTRSLGVVDCWRNPTGLGAAYREVADGPRGLTPAQEADRTRPWHRLW